MATVQSVVRAFSVLQALAAGPSGVSEISATTELPKSTVSRLLATLEDVGAVERSTEGMLYRLGSGLSDITGTAHAPRNLGRAVLPHLETLSSRLGEASGLSVPDSYSVQYVLQIESPDPVQVRDYSGLSLPMHVGPSGLVMMAQWPLENVQHYLMRPLEAFTTKTVTDSAAITRRLARFRSDGYGWVYEEFADGINSVATPVTDANGAPIAAIHVHGPAFRFPGSRSPEEIAAVLVDETRRFMIRAELT